MHIFLILTNFIFAIESNIIPNGGNIFSKVSNVCLDWTISCYPNSLVLLAELDNEILTSKFFYGSSWDDFNLIFYSEGTEILYLFNIALQWSFFV